MSSPDVTPATAPGPPPAEVLAGRLHVYVAFDWGDEIDLEHAGRLAPGAALALSRRPRTPTSFTYKPPPLRFRLAPVTLDLPGGQRTTAEATEATVFDFAAVSVAFRVHFRMTAAELTALAGHLAEPATGAALIQAARAAVGPLHEKLLPTVQAPRWQDDQWEEYFVFQFPPGEPLTPDVLLGERAGWLAGLLRLEDQPLSAEEAAEAVRLPLRYGRHDLFLPDWAAAVLLDHEGECDETLQTVEFANLQLLEYRHIDDRLDAALAGANRATRGGWLPIWRSHAAPLRRLGELKVEANGLFERTGNVLKLIGDQYLARVYGLLATRFHLREWERSIQRKLEVIEGLYKVVADQTVTFRMEFMEAVVIGLILLEVLLAVFRH
ncbi:MAG TPA: hypothetical protein VFE78_00710 [Gemmataceae bacterium]|jgi:hypothetical protein|nr:hypothetical protein [Gemmataceae bacterium]